MSKLLKFLISLNLVLLIINILIFLGKVLYCIYRWNKVL